MKQPSHQVINYVIIISEHNLPNLTSVISQPVLPKTLWLIHTSNLRFSEAAKRFKQVMNEDYPSLQVIIITATEGFSGENFAELKQWINQYLTPHYQTHTDEKWILNINGGTKIIPIQLIKALSWAEIHYKAMNQQTLQRWTLDDSVLPDYPLKAPLPLQAIRTYTPCFVTHNKIDLNPQATAIAQKIWDAFLPENPNHPHRVLAQLFKTLWHTSDAPVGKMLTIDLNTIQTNDLTAFKAWCKELAELDAQAISVNETQLTLPGKNNTKNKNWKKWVAGVWLETLLAHWLTEAGVTHFARSVEIREPTRDLDFVLIKQGNLQLIEAKVEPVDETKLKDIIRQITSLVRAGKLEYYLFVSPLFDQSITNQQRKEDFYETCKQNHITVLSSKQQLLAQLAKNA